MLLQELNYRLNQFLNGDAVLDFSTIEKASFSRKMPALFSMIYPYAPSVAMFSNFNPHYKIEGAIVSSDMLLAHIVYYFIYSEKIESESKQHFLKLIDANLKSTIDFTTMTSVRILNFLQEFSNLNINNMSYDSILYQLSLIEKLKNHQLLKMNDLEKFKDTQFGLLVHYFICKKPLSKTIEHPVFMSLNVLSDLRIFQSFREFDQSLKKSSSTEEVEIIL